MLSTVIVTGMSSDFLDFFFVAVVQYSWLETTGLGGKYCSREFSYLAHYDAILSEIGDMMQKSLSYWQV